jgi:hypothetical protein
MVKIKEHNYIIKDDVGNLIIRSIKNSDLTFYKEWFRNGHILKDAVNKIPEEEIEKWILNDAKRQYIFIIEIDKKPYGEIVLWNDTTLVMLDKNYKKPFYSIMIKFYENITNNDIDNILKLFIESIKRVKIKMNLLYVLIDKEEKQNYTNNYLKNGFENISKELYKTKLEKFFVKNNIENPYEKSDMLIKNI